MKTLFHINGLDYFSEKLIALVFEFNYSVKLAKSENPSSVMKFLFECSLASPPPPPKKYIFLGGRASV